MDNFILETDWVLIEIDGVAMSDGDERLRASIRVSARPDNLESDALIADAANCTVTGNAGCNRYRGSCRVTAQAIAFGTLAVTRMLCPPPTMELERRFLAALAGRSQWTAVHDSLILNTAASTLRFRAALPAGAP